MAAHAALGANESAGAPVVADRAHCPGAWQTLLAGSVSGDAEADRRAASSGAVMADLSHFGLIAVAGPEAGKFLGSLFTGDVRMVTAERGQFTSWCDGKGRMLATFWLFLRDDIYYLLLPLQLLPTTVSRLRQFLLRTKASISDASELLARIGLSGAGLAAQLGVDGELAAEIGTTLQLGECTLVAIGSAPQPRWLAIGPAEALGALWRQLLAVVRPVGSDTWGLLDILAGIAWLTPETSGEFIPQMVNLEALGGLSFTKGCYPGQEVVARLQYRGQLKRRVYVATVAADEVPLPGSKLYGPGTSESVGMVLSAAPAAAGRVALLAVVVIERQESGTIHLHDLAGPTLVFAAAGGSLPVDPT